MRCALAFSKQKDGKRTLLLEQNYSLEGRFVHRQVAHINNKIERLNPLGSDQSWLSAILAVVDFSSPRRCVWASDDNGSDELATDSRQETDADTIQADSVAKQGYVRLSGIVFKYNRGSEGTFFSYL